MANEKGSLGSGSAEGPGGLEPQEKKNLLKAAVFVACALGFILGLKLLLGY